MLFRDKIIFHSSDLCVCQGGFILSAGYLANPLLLKQHFAHQQHRYFKMSPAEFGVNTLRVCFVALAAKSFVRDAMKQELE